MAKNAARPPKAKSLNRSLHAAKATKQDEFYTQLSDIEKELKHYTAHFKGKTVLCNCDDPRVSNFFKYFVNQHSRRQSFAAAAAEKSVSCLVPKSSALLSPTRRIWRCLYKVING